MVVLNGPRWLILFGLIFCVAITGLIAMGVLVPGLEPAAIALVYSPFLALILLGVGCEGILRYYAKDVE
jgi:hypothetical protein